jgi:hypothetical protein
MHGPYRAIVPVLFHRSSLNRLFSSIFRRERQTPPAAQSQVMSPMKKLPLIGTAAAATLALIASSSIGAQASSQRIPQTIPQSIVGAWRADAPLPNGVVQTFRFDPDGKFDLAQALAVEGQYRIDGNQLIETVTLPSVGMTHTDTATFTIKGDSLIVSERTGAPPRVLRRTGAAVASAPITGDWAITVGNGVAAHYVFGADGTMHMHAQVGDEQGKYVVRADTLHLSNDQTFQLPAIAHFAVADSVLTLTPQNGKQARQFHRVPQR